MHEVACQELFTNDDLSCLLLLVPPNLGLPLLVVLFQGGLPLRQLTDLLKVEVIYWIRLNYWRGLWALDFDLHTGVYDLG